MSEIKHDSMSLYTDVPVESEAVQDARDKLRQRGSVDAAFADRYFARASTACVAILRDHVRGLGAVDLDEVRQQIQAYAQLPTPYLPEPARSFNDLLEPEEPDTFMWVDPRRILLNRPADQTFVDQTMWYVEKILDDQASPAGLGDLFGTMDAGEASHIHCEGWQTPHGPILRIDVNGNHRLAALAALEAPCVLARVRMHGKTFEAAWITDDDGEQYRRLLQTFDVATYLNNPAYPLTVVTTWPILLRSPADAVTSLAALEERTGTYTWKPIGQLPRRLFDDTAELIEAAESFERLRQGALDPSRKDRHPLARFGQWLQGS